MTADPDVVRFFDTTLRDGEQARIALTKDEKVEIAEQLARLNVDILEAGFAISSDGEFDAVREIATSVKGPVIASLARVVPGDIERAAGAEGRRALADPCSSRRRRSTWRTCSGCRTGRSSTGSRRA